jgi:hypothetical protein
VASGEIEGDAGDDVEDKLWLDHRNEVVNDARDEIVVVQAGRWKDDVGTDTQNPSP